MHKPQFIHELLTVAYLRPIEEYVKVIASLGQIALQLHKLNTLKLPKQDIYCS